MIIKDDRTPEEVESTIGFIVAKDKYMSGWGDAPGRSMVACPVTSSRDADRVWKTFEDRSGFVYLRWIAGSQYKAKTFRLRSSDHLQIYDTTSSFRV